MRLYLDTNVIMDFLLGRDSAAYKLIIKICIERHEVIVSSLLLQELEKHGLRIDPLIALLQSHTMVIFCSATKDDRMQAELLPTHYADALHKVLATRYGADILVTKNVKDFPFKDILIKRADEL
jgi:predicted nucleic acid-binding protein